MADSPALISYREKVQGFLAPLDLVDVISINEIGFRHQNIKQQLATLIKLKDHIKALASKVETRDAEGFFPELRTYQRHVGYFQKYCDDFKMELIDSDTDKQQENNMQLDLLNSIMKLETFIESITRKEKEEDVVVDASPVIKEKVRANRVLSLVDRRII